MADVFISYKRDDLLTVQKLVAALRDADVNVWWDQDIAPDAPWEATIERELEAASAVIVAWSQAAVASDNVKAEARRARQQGKLIQVFAESCEPPLFFGERQGVNLKGWTGDTSDGRFQSVLAGIRAIVAGRRPPDGVGFTAKPKPTWLLPASVAMLAAVAIVIVAGLTISGDALCTVAGIECRPTRTTENQRIAPSTGAEVMAEATPSIAEPEEVAPQTTPSQAVPRDPLAYFPNAANADGFCETIREVAAMVDQDFTPWRLGDPVSISGGVVWRSSYRLPGAASCNVQQTNPQVPPSYACRWDTPSPEDAARESERLAQAIMRCPNAVRGGEGRPLIGNAIFWVHPVDIDIARNQVRVIVMWS